MSLFVFYFYLFSFISSNVHSNLTTKTFLSHYRINGNRPRQAVTMKTAEAATKGTAAKSDTIKREQILRSLISSKEGFKKISVEVQKRDLNCRTWFEEVLPEKDGETAMNQRIKTGFEKRKSGCQLGVRSGNCTGI